jgi:hypothetical protein
VHVKISAKPRGRTLGVGIAATMTISLALVGCTSGGSPAPSGSPDAGTTSATPTPEPVLYTPLTGEAQEAGEHDNPSIASKIDNQLEARPQIGLQYTDLVFEELVEGGITRYVAVWHSDIPKEYGPVRSIRGMDPDIISPLKGIVTYSGGQPIFVKWMANTPVTNVVMDQIGYADDIFRRTTDKIAPHNVIANADNVLNAYGDGLEPPAPQFAFAPDASQSSAVLFGDKTTSRIEANFSDSSYQSWKWNAKNLKWVRSQNGVVDRDDKGKPLTADNVIVLRVTVSTVSHTPKTNFEGDGEAWVSSGGSTIHGTWTKKKKTADVKVLDESGNPVRLTPGNTWIELVPDSGSVKFVE